MSPAIVCVCVWWRPLFVFYKDDDDPIGSFNRFEKKNDEFHIIRIKNHQKNNRFFSFDLSNFHFGIKFLYKQIINQSNIIISSFFNIQFWVSFWNFVLKTFSIFEKSTFFSWLGYILFIHKKINFCFVFRFSDH